MSGFDKLVRNVSLSIIYSLFINSLISSIEDFEINAYFVANGLGKQIRGFAFLLTGFVAYHR